MASKTKVRKRIPPYIIPFLKEIEKIFGLSHYDRSITLEDSDKSDDGGRRYAATVDIQQDYQRVHLVLYPCFFDVNREGQRMYILHEFCHYLTTDLLKTAHDLLDGKLVTHDSIRVASEKATSQTTNLLDNLLLNYHVEAKKAYKKFSVVPKKKKRKRVGK